MPATGPITLPGTAPSVPGDWAGDRLASLAARLIAAPSENPDPDGWFELLAVDALEREATALGFRVSRQPVAPGRDNLHIVAAGDRPAAPVVFLGHSDVVPAGAGWTRDPFVPVVEGGRLYGRGATDMKGGLAAAIAAMDVLSRDTGFAHPVELIVTVDEEDYATGVRRYLEEVPDREFVACIVAEPTDLDVVVGCRGAANLHLDIAGVAAHAGRPADGASAIVAASRIVALLQAEHEDWAQRAGETSWAPTWNVGRIDGGHGTSIVPDRCAIDVDRRMMPHEQPDEILRDLLAAIDDAGITSDTITVTGRLDMSMPGFLTDEDDPLPRLALDAVRASGIPDARIRRWTAACEGGFLARQHGAPTIVLGPGDVTTEAHQPDESVALRDLDAAAEAYVRLAAALADRVGHHADLGGAPDVPPPHAVDTPSLSSSP
ncbi:acetylornithine deacetylase [Pseudoclavibacter endophyticus]|nr:M20 family metallopeptidase [Pseudoclavibacter endophyticus]GGA56155.1 acetylornithine deacetylase [Pseudoclavibacter endophyticus]